MSTAGVPILGDGAYPTPTASHDEDFTKPLQLIARSLSFTDPLDGTPREFATPRTGSPRV